MTPDVVNGEAPAGRGALTPPTFPPISPPSHNAVRWLATRSPTGVLEEFRVTLPQTGVRALLDVPVFHHGHLWGVVCFEDCEHTRLGRRFAAHASSAVDLLSLAHEVSERIRKLHATRERHRVHPGEP